MLIFIMNLLKIMVNLILKKTLFDSTKNNNNKIDMINKRTLKKYILLLIFMALIWYIIKIFQNIKFFVALILIQIKFSNWIKHNIIEISKTIKNFIHDDTYIIIIKL